MKNSARKILAPAVLLLFMAAASATAQTPDAAKDGVRIVDRGGRLRNFPCAECHGLINEPEEREDQAHAEVKVRHGELNRDCLNCHDPEDVGRLRLMGGGTVAPFEASYKQCSQCHGNVLKDWESGVHGAQTGFWNGLKQRRTCTACHDPHEPAFKAIKPLPPPRRPGRGS